MFIGRGFDTNNDGNNDVFVGGSVSQKDMQAAGCLLMIFLPVLVVVVLICSAAESDGAKYWESVRSTTIWAVGIGLALLAVVGLCMIRLWLGLTLLLAIGFGVIGTTYFKAVALRNAQQEAAKREQAEQEEKAKVQALKEEILRKIKNRRD